MTNDPEQMPGTYSGAASPTPPLNFDAVTGQALPPVAGPPRPQMIAPVWHTVAVVAIILGISYSGSSRLVPAAAEQGRIVIYVQTIIWQLFLLGVVWIGLRLRQTRLRDVIGGRWKSVEDGLLDAGIAAGFWFVSAMILVGLKFAMGMASLNNQQSVDQVKKAIGSFTPRTSAELAVFVALVVCAGIVEEIIFRGYLQRQIGAIARNTYAGLVISAIIFGAAHGYQGKRQMVLLGIYGAMFGTLALLRKSLRPGMMAHAWQDALSGILLYVLTKMGKM
jgi:uncharacterized protein